jgi:hypothetical protein
MHVPADVASRLQRTRWSHWSAPFQLWFPLSVYVASRLISAAFIIAAAGPAHRSGYSDMATAWDGEWYRYIATTGYPANLPTGAGGQVLQNPWAFSPGYPLTVRALMAVTRQDFSLVAPTLSLVLGAAAIVVIFVLLERAVSRFYACACVILTCTFMAAPSMQIAYTESLALLLLAGALLLLREHKYVAVAALLLALSLTRPVVLAFIPVVIAHGLTRWRRQESDPFPAGDRRAVVLLTAWCVAVTALWSAIVAVGTRDVFAWIKTQEAWRVTPHFAPRLGWPASIFHYYGWPALAMLAFVVLVTLWIGVRPGARAWGPELRTWIIAYPAYLLLTTDPIPSVIRWILLAFPLMWPFPEEASTRSEHRFRVILIACLVVVGLALQWFWVSSFLGARAPSDWYP